MGNGIYSLLLLLFRRLIDNPDKNRLKTHYIILIEMHIRVCSLITTNPYVYNPVSLELVKLIHILYIIVTIKPLLNPILHRS